jgi:hypothetical protein
MLTSMEVKKVRKKIPPSGVVSEVSIVFPVVDESEDEFPVVDI